MSIYFTPLFVLKIVLGVIALTLAVMKGKSDKHIMFYWLLVSLYWFLNALS